MISRTGTNDVEDRCNDVENLYNRRQRVYALYMDSTLAFGCTPMHNCSKGIPFCLSQLVCLLSQLVRLLSVPALSSRFHRLSAILLGRFQALPYPKRLLFLKFYIL